MYVTLNTVYVLLLKCAWEPPIPLRCNLFNLLEIHRAQLTIYLFIPQPEPAAARDKSNTREELNAFNSSYYLQCQLHKRRRVRKAESFSGSRNPPPPKRLVACRRVCQTRWPPHRASTSRCATPVTRESHPVGLPVGPDAERPEIAADVVPGYVYGMWVSMQHIDRAVGEEAWKFYRMQSTFHDTIDRWDFIHGDS
ncbi:hypothetical protein DFH09DRAFT_1084368 [Mycena vulgaris]|nr:hypothetical protein DFH09DRAFT_1084368 [Mycena vulgaris]